MKSSPRRLPYDNTQLESHLCIGLGHWLSRRGYEIYPELSSDLTAYHRGRDELIGVEAKRDLNFKVLQQALQKHRIAGFDAVFVCTTGSAVSRFWAPKICAHAEVNLGVVVVSKSTPYDIQLWGPAEVEVLLRAPSRRHHARRDRLLDLMCPEAQVYATPGSTGPQDFSPFRMQEVTLYRAIRELGPQGITVAEALAMLGKKVRKDRLIELFGKKVFGTLACADDRITIRAEWGSKEAGHSGITWSAPDPALDQTVSEVLQVPTTP